MIKHVLTLILIALISLHVGLLPACAQTKDEFKREEKECEESGGIYDHKAFPFDYECYTPGSPLYEVFLCVQNEGVLQYSNDYGVTPSCITKESCESQGGTTTNHTIGTSLKRTTITDCFIPEEFDPELTARYKEELIQYLPKTIISQPFKLTPSTDMVALSPDFRFTLIPDGAVTAEAKDSSRENNNDWRPGGSWRIRNNLLILNVSAPGVSWGGSPLYKYTVLKLGLEEDQLTVDGVTVGEDPIEDRHEEWERWDPRIYPGMYYRGLIEPENVYTKREEECLKKGGVFSEVEWWGGSEPRCVLQEDPDFPGVYCTVNGGAIVSGSPQTCIPQEECTKKGGHLARNTANIVVNCGLPSGVKPDNTIQIPGAKNEEIVPYPAGSVMFKSDDFNNGL